MAYLIETYAKNKDNTMRLVNIDAGNKFETKEAANIHIVSLLKEQESDNNELMQMYYERLQSQLFDEDTNDQIMREPKLYAYTFKAAKYSNRQTKNLA